MAKEVWFGLVAILSILAFIKNDVTYRHHKMIGNAIYAYNMRMILYGGSGESQVGYDDMESYNETFLRFWDWGPTRILSPEKYEIIKPYIGEE